MKRMPLIVGVLLVVIAVLIGLGLNYTSSPAFCSSCHTITPFADAWKGSSHERADVTCIDCHFEPGAVGYIKGKTYSVIKLAQWAMGETDRKPEASRTIVAGACRHCHPDPQATFIPHSFHTETANLECTECHSGVVHGSKLVGEEKPQAAAVPQFCNSCHTGDFAPILFTAIEPAGREHPGAPKIDVNVWRNIHWRMADAPAVIDGVQYDKIEKDTCLACHQEPTVARACKSCHAFRPPEFSASSAAARASLVPTLLFAFLFALFMVAVFLRRGEKERFFSSMVLRVAAIVVVLSDVFVVYLIVSDVLREQTGHHEVGPTTVWVSYLLLSIALVGFLLFEAGLLPSPLRKVSLPPEDEDAFLVPKPLRRMKVRTPGGTPPPDAHADESPSGESAPGAHPTPEDRTP